MNDSTGLPKSALESLGEIRERIEAAPLIGLFIDFDGTISEIVPSPTEAVLGAGIESILRRLLKHPGFVVGIVTGRALDDVKQRVDLPGLLYIGNHGLETEVHGVYARRAEADALRTELRRLSLQLQLALADVPGVEMEDKALTLTVHFRRVEPELHPWIVRTVTEAVERTPDFSTRPGKKVFEVRPRLNVSKGTALRELCSQVLPGAGLPIYIGDDVSDEDAFAAIPEGITIRVGEATQTEARYVVPGVPDVARFLDWLTQIKLHGSLATGQRVG